MVELFLLIMVTVAIASELGLRWFLGFGNPPLYVADETIGYRLAPNQRTRRFGNRITINQFSLRGPEINPDPAPETRRILLLGDSLANGGWWTDDARTISAQLQERLGTPDQPVEVLNASANSWGPRNQWEYVRKFGIFGATEVVLLLNTDDLFSRQPTSVVVGRDRSYPDKRPPLAWVELISRFLPPEEIPELAQLRQEDGDVVQKNLEAIGQLCEYLKAENVSLLVLLTPLKRELGEPGPRPYEQKARERLANHLKEYGITYVDVLQTFNGLDNPENLYRDTIHFNASGNHILTELLRLRLSNLFKIQF
ncbi:SGNH/GDSL hydrolase family protein [Sodalinema gerasimenkoae]|uniref:SGNH/GDSL hydrolase family protein n=1 Tax=Sodalinema gerasimenkoae TaxID=2862348 RepID=UPI001FE47913|nr:SGNH/GDSL hydrolase family protein [Sodalinema gerasimenkoae]